MNHEVYLHGQIPETQSFLLKGEIVRFASACSGIAISRFPLPLNPPTPEEVAKMSGQKNLFF